MGNTKLIFTGKTIAIAILLLGIVHDVATFTPLIQSGLEMLNVANLNSVIYMSLICGSSLILSGLLLIMFFNKVLEYSFLKSAILIISVFLAINGILSVIYMFDNPFAWISLLLNMSIFFVAVRLKQLNN